MGSLRLQKEQEKNTEATEAEDNVTEVEGQAQAVETEANETEEEEEVHAVETESETEEEDDDEDDEDYEEAYHIEWLDDGHEWIGKRVRRHFEGHGYVTGTIKQWADEDCSGSDPEPAVFHVIHD